MVTRRAFLFLSDSMLTVGSGSLSDVTSAAFTRWTGTTFPAGYPKDVSVPDVEMLTPNMPYGQTATSYVASSGASTVTTVDSVFVATDVSRWVYVKSGTGQGQRRRISAYTSATQVTLAVAWTTQPDTTSVIELWQDSHSYSSHTTNVAANTSTITKLADSLDWANTANTWVVVIDGTGIHQARKVVSASVDDVVVTPALTTTPSANAGLRQLTGANSVNVLADIVASKCQLAPMRFFQDAEKSSYSAPTEYPNWYSAPLVNPVAHASNNAINAVPEFLWQMRQVYTGKITGIGVGIGGATLTPTYYGSTFAAVTFSWLSQVTHNDFHVDATSGLYAVAIAQCAAFRDICIANGDEPSIEAVLVHLGTNDALDADRAATVLNAMTTLRDAVRLWITQNGLSKRSSSQLPWIMGSCPTSRTYASTVNTQLKQIETDDPWSGYVDGSAFQSDDGVHVDEVGAIQMGQAFATKLLAVQKAAADAAGLDSALMSLATLRSRVKRRWERSASSNAASTAMLDQCINDALREVYTTLGDNAWFLRRQETMTLTGSYPSTLTLKRPVLRLLKIEDSASPGRRIVWHGLSYTDNGRVRLTLHTVPSGQCVVHYMTMPGELVSEEDRMLVPSQHAELVVMLACKRLAEAAGSQSVASYYVGETAMLWKVLKRDAQRFDRFRQESLTPYDAYDSFRNGSGEMQDFYL